MAGLGNFLSVWHLNNIYLQILWYLSFHKIAQFGYNICFCAHNRAIIQKQIYKIGKSYFCKKNKSFEPEKNTKMLPLFFLVVILDCSFTECATLGNY